MNNYTPIEPSPAYDNVVNQHNLPPNQHNLPPNQHNLPPPLRTVVQQYPVEFGPRPQIAYCLNCERKQVTRIEYKRGNKTNVAALILCLLGCWPCCLCCIPYCMNSMKYAMHYCSVCGQFMGIYDK